MPVAEAPAQPRELRGIPRDRGGDQRSGGVTEASSLLGGSPRRPCGRKGSPYHTGQLHPAVRVADLLQHINQMKTAEGYGFKQEYEGFFEGWDAMRKKPSQRPMPESPEGGPEA
ncbi:receptor-type tyrosine-protein phosphatase U-like [Prionailurus viverrinus]|uniref:receptor-type tyrosine-protein phosphatase U-like n=1 Tax=Prionailurus viverrinus TaxID=61388 RepID=UPI001FF4C283|nr:receptor-type tyrosine-protein phosphatase U-like [Prionailurus viverrinus]